MSPHESKLNRREFLKTTAGLTLAAATGVGIEAFADEIKPKYDARVVLVRDQNLFIKEGEVAANIVGRMLDDGIAALFDNTNTAKIWKTLIKPDDVVGIKSNDWPPLPTPPEIEQALKDRALAAGANEKNISIRDKGLRDDPIFEKVTALINVRPMRTHHWSGVGSLIKNYIQFVPKPWEYHDEFCSPLATIWNLPQVKGKTRLNVLVMFTPLFHGIGPHHYDKSYTWRYNGLLLGTDPVAVDTVGLEIFKAKRREYFKEDRQFTPPAIHIARADTKYHLGTANLDKIELIKLGWTEGRFI